MDYWFIQEAKAMPDRRNGGSMTRITLVNIVTQQTADTYICPANRNSRNWFAVLKHLDKGMILGNLRVVKANKKNCISADSEPEIAWMGEPELLAEEIRRYWSKNNFTDLFD